MKRRYSIIISIPKSFFRTGDLEHWTNHEAYTENLRFTFWGEEHDYLPEIQECEHTPVVLLKDIAKAYRRGVFKK